MKARIKSGNDNRKEYKNGAMLKWSDITGIKEGSYVELLSECKKTNTAVVLYNGKKRLVPRDSIELSVLDDVIEKSKPGWANTNTDLSLFA